MQMVRLHSLAIERLSGLRRFLPTPPEPELGTMRLGVLWFGSRALR